jgi:hypothetical protein
MQRRTGTSVRQRDLQVSVISISGIKSVKGSDDGVFRIPDDGQKPRNPVILNKWNVCYMSYNIKRRLSNKKMLYRVGTSTNFLRRFFNNLCSRCLMSVTSSLQSLVAFSNSITGKQFRIKLRHVLSLLQRIGLISGLWNVPHFSTPFIL